MKIIALIDEPGRGEERELQTGMSFYQKIKEEREADALVVVTSGGFGQNGSTEEMDKYRKAELIRARGADLVMELPVYCTLTTYDTFAFAAVSMLEKLNCIDELILFTKNAEPGLLSRIVRFLFIESKEYQDTVKRYRSEGRRFVRAQAAAVERYIPGAGEVLECNLNRKAVEYAKAMKRMYSTMKVCFYDVEKDGQPDKNTENADASIDRMKDADQSNARVTDDSSAVWRNRISQGLALQFREILEEIPEEQQERYLNETAGGYAPETQRLLREYREHGIEDFEQFAETLAADGRPMNDVKRYLLRAILGIRQVDISICGLYSYALYARALGAYENCAVFDQVKAASWIPVFSENDPEDKAAAKAAARMDDSGRILLEIDRRAVELHRRLFRLHV